MVRWRWGRWCKFRNIREIDLSMEFHRALQRVRTGSQVVREAVLTGQHLPALNIGGSNPGGEARSEISGSCSTKWVGAEQ